MNKRILSSLSLNQQLTLLIAILAVLGTIIAAFISGHDWFQISTQEGAVSITPTVNYDNKLDGVWKGETSLGETIYFEVKDNIVEFIEIGFSGKPITGVTPCGGGTFGYQRAHIENNGFIQVAELTYLNVQIEGKFESSSVASGTISSPAPPLNSEDCEVVFSTWKAIRK